MAQSQPVGQLLAVCISEQKGTRKHPVPAIELQAGYGVVGDAHGGSARQVSLLAQESIAKMAGLGLELGAGDFAENITTTGLLLHHLPVGTHLTVGPARLRISQIGKECHAGCEIRTLTGACIMPTEGVFAEVLVGGEIKPGDPIYLEDVPCE